MKSRVHSLLLRHWITSVVVIRRAYGVVALVSSLAMVTGCMSAMKAVAPKVNVTIYRVDDNRANRANVKKCVESIAQEFGFTEEPGEIHGLIVRYTLDRHGSSHAPYGISAVIHEGEPGLASTNDITNFVSLAARLNKPSASDGISQYLKGRLSTATLDLLFNFNGTTSEQLKEGLRKDINHIIFSGGLIYDAQRFAGIRLSTETSQLLDEEAYAHKLVEWRLNRMLLHDAYPQEIAGMEKDHIDVHLAHANLSGKKTAQYLEMETRLTSKFNQCFNGRVRIWTYLEWTP